MAKLLFFFFGACNPAKTITPTSHLATPRDEFGTIDARHYILIAYLEQYKQNPKASMDAFAKAQQADQNSSIIYLLWGDSAWEQGQKEKARWAWKEYEQKIESNDTENLNRIKERLERS